MRRAHVVSVYFACMRVGLAVRNSSIVYPSSSSFQDQRVYRRDHALHTNSIRQLAELLFATPLVGPFESHRHEITRRYGKPYMVQGILQDGPREFRSDSVTPAVRQLPPGSFLPKLIVFDLDNTLWTPELYTLKGLRDQGLGPVAGSEVWLLDGAAAALYELATCDEWKATKVAVASRTQQGDWAKQLLKEFEVPGHPNLKIGDMLVQAEIYPGNKKKHFNQLAKDLGIPYDEMLFFDDSADGKYGNCVPVSELGVLSAHCIEGLTSRVWLDALKKYAELSKSGAAKGLVFRAALEHPVNGIVKSFMADKGFGFIHVDNQQFQGDAFFHINSLQETSCERYIRVGDQVQVTLGQDEQGRKQCRQVWILDKPSILQDESVTLPCFSMGMPFAALLAHGVKTIETRRNDMFESYADKTVLLHAGKKDFFDDGKHLQILKANGVSKEDIARFTELPSGFSRGQIVAVVQLGSTSRLASGKASPEIENAVVAFKEDMGTFLTKVKRVAWLREPVTTSGRPGFYSATIPKSALPEDMWDLEQKKGARSDTKKIRYWKITGGKASGGIKVRTGAELSSEVDADKLSCGAIVKELEFQQDTERLQYELFTGTGPSTGWISRSLKSGKELCVIHAIREEPVASA